MRVSLTRFKKTAMVLAGAAFAATFLINAVPARTAGQDDAAALFKAKCVACHGATLAAVV